MSDKLKLLDPELNTPQTLDMRSWLIRTWRILNSWLFTSRSTLSLGSPQTAKMSVQSDVDLFSSDGEPMSPEIPLQTGRTESGIGGGDTSDSEPECEQPAIIVQQQEKRRKRCRSESENDHSVPESIQEIKRMLVSLTKKVEENKKVLEEMQHTRDQSSGLSSSTDSTPTRKKQMSPRVWQEVRKTYKCLQEEKENFGGWCIAPWKSIKSPENDVIMRALIKEVRGQNPSFDAVDIREAAYRFYKTKCEEDALIKSGKIEVKKIGRRRHERITRKRKERESAIQKNGKLTIEQKSKWLAVMKNEYMSSEESGEEDTMIVHPLPWRSNYMNRMIDKIDQYCFSKKSPQAKRQTKPRVCGANSCRVKPMDPISWAVDP